MFPGNKEKRQADAGSKRQHEGHQLHFSDQGSLRGDEGLILALELFLRACTEIRTSGFSGYTHGWQTPADLMVGCKIAAFTRPA
jgi:hypothetical protein